MINIYEKDEIINFYDIVKYEYFYCSRKDFCSYVFVIILIHYVCSFYMIVSIH